MEKELNLYASGKDVGRSLVAARERVARLAEKDGEVVFAREVRAGCWDHRNDVQAALQSAPHAIFSV